MVKSLTEAALLDDYARLAQNYDDLLALPKVQEAPQRTSLEHNRRVLQELIDGETLTPARAKVYATATRHLYQGVRLQELGYDPAPVDPRQAESRAAIRELVPFLYDQADATERLNADEVVEELDMQVYPADDVSLLGLLVLAITTAVPEDLLDRCERLAFGERIPRTES